MTAWSLLIILPVALLYCENQSIRGDRRMSKLLEALLPWGPVFFGVLLFAPIAAAVMDSLAFSISAGFPSLYLAIPVGFIWGLVAKARGRWL